MSLSRLRICLLVTAATLVSAAGAGAHGMGASYFAQHLEVRLGTDWVHVVYALEVPVSILQREFVDVAREHRDVPLDDLKQDFRERKVTEIRRGLELTLNGHHLALEDDPDGESDVRPNDRVFMLYRFALRAPVGSLLEAENALELHTSNYEGRDTLYALDVDAGDGISEIVTGLEGDERFFVDPRTETAWYPSSQHRNPTLRFRLGPGEGGSAPTRPGAERTMGGGQASDRLERLLEADPRTVSGWGLALVVAFGLGAAHAVSPGHGKGRTVAFLTGSSARVRDAIALAAATGLTHAVVAIALALVTLTLLDRVLPATVARYLTFASGGLVVLVGVWMLTRAAPRTDPLEGAQPLAHAARPRPRLRELISLGVSSGLVPSPGGIAVLLLGVATAREVLAVAMVGAYGLGVGALLAVVGVAAVLAGRDVERWIGEGRRSWLARLPTASAAIVILSGLGIMAKTLLDQTLPVG